MTAPSTSRRAYHAWVEVQLEECKAALTRDELLELAEEACQSIGDSPDGQYALTEILLRDAVDALLFERLALPDYRQWARACRSDTLSRPLQGTGGRARAAG